eukprot:1039528-Karenia_brevis.AAC.1
MLKQSAAFQKVEQDVAGVKSQLSDLGKNQRSGFDKLEKLLMAFHTPRAPTPRAAAAAGPPAATESLVDDLLVTDAAHSKFLDMMGLKDAALSNSVKPSGD